MKPIKSSCMTFFSSLLLLIASVAHAEENPYVISLDKERIHMPTSGPIQHTIPNDQPHIRAFAGPLVLSGTVKIYWYDSIIDDSDVNNLKYEKKLAIDFFPSADSLGELPLVIYDDEPLKLPIKIDMDGSMENLNLLVGKQEAMRINRLKKNLQIRGDLNVLEYRTYVECNSRQFEVSIAGFNKKTKPIEMKADDNSGCGR